MPKTKDAEAVKSMEELLLKNHTEVDIIITNCNFKFDYCLFGRLTLSFIELNYF